MAIWSAFLARPARPSPVARPSKTLFFLLAGAFILTLVPFAIQFPSWLSIAIVVAMVARCVLEAYRLPLPSTTFTTILALILLGLVVLQYGHFIGRDFGTALTAGLLAIKFYELRRPRDVSLIIFSCFFVVMSALLYSQVLELFIYCLIMMWVLTALLTRVQTGDQPDDFLLQMLKKSGIIFLQALPLALFLFFFFPRYPGPIGIHLDEATIGISDVVAPGSIADLAMNDSEAMYVQFPPGSSVPTTDTMYWRALVLWNYENGIWTQGQTAWDTASIKPKDRPEQGQVEQEVTLLAHHQRWLFALDRAASLPVDSEESFSWAYAVTGNVMLLSHNLDHMARYDVISNTLTPPEETLGGNEQFAGIHLPDDPTDRIDPEVKNLALSLFQGLSDKGDQEEEHMAAVIHYFRHGGFSYSVTPGVYPPGSAWLRPFLFNRRTGFCEHYASAFAVLMRLGHIPTRLVVGYLGAEYNPYADKYVVSQSNAHAWDEIWIRDRNQPPEGVQGRWVRVDPTALITALEPGQRGNNLGGNNPGAVKVAERPPGFIDKYFPEWAKSELKEIKLRREQLETGWDNVVLSYDTGAQGRMAQALGFGNNFQVGLMAVCLAAAALCIFIFRRWITRKAKISPVENLYTAFCRNMARRGIPRATWEGPLAYTERVAEAFPDDKPAIHRVGSIVARARYGPSPIESNAPDDLHSLLAQITASNAAASSRERR